MGSEEGSDGQEVWFIWVDERCIQGLVGKLLWKKLLDVAGRVILKWILKKCDDRTW